MNVKMKDNRHDRKKNEFIITVFIFPYDRQILKLTRKEALCMLN